MAKKRFFVESELVFKEKLNGKFQDLTGQKFGRLTVLGFAGRKNKQTYWFCKCDCGNIKRLQSANLKNGNTASCGCFRKECITERNTVHGHASHGSESPTFNTWAAMTKRCRGTFEKHFINYVKRGITICERWHKFENFLEDMGERPENKTLDRKDNNKGYYKENCRWATRKEQQNNTRRNRIITFNNKTQTLAQWAEETGIDYRVIQERLNRSWPPELALTLKPDRNRRNFTKHSKNAKSNP